MAEEHIRILLAWQCHAKNTFPAVSLIEELGHL